IISLAWLADSQRAGRPAVLASASFGLTSLGLVLSGARGAWLGLCLGAAAMVLVQRDPSAMRRAVRLGAALLALAAITLLSGVGGFLYERIAGSASHPASWAQRYDALLAVASWGRRIPLIGLGFGGATELTARMGMLLPNLENEYLRFLLAAGVAGPLVLLVTGVRRIRSAIRLPSGPVRTAGIGCLTALFVNMGTYNLFSWSIAPSLFMALAVVTLRSVREPAPDGFAVAHRMAVRPA
ncbi:MAG TPA: O-antigen ligase family protein, partial [Candidatus Eisenbacteria bacterium]|nr:O-antigen ligase family protein [Candidatus Eisenbacteria bacterium]